MSIENQAHDHHEQDSMRPKPQTPEQGLQGTEGVVQTTVDPAIAFQHAATAPPPAINPNDILSLQQASGNQAVQRLINQRKAMGSSAPLIIQPKLTVTPPGDKYEQEADQMASQVMQRISSAQGGAVQRQEEEEEELQTMPLASIQRQAEEEEELQAKSAETIQRAGTDTVPQVDSGIENSINSARGGGESLPENVRGQMEQGFGADFSDVRVHTDSGADGLNQSLQARAFTTGQDIFFKSGEYSPDTSSGQQLLAHELTHVVQQGGADSLSTKNIQREVFWIGGRAFNANSYEEAYEQYSGSESSTSSSSQSRQGSSSSSESESTTSGGSSTGRRGYPGPHNRPAPMPPLPSIGEEGLEPIFQERYTAGQQRRGTLLVSYANFVAQAGMRRFDSQLYRGLLEKLKQYHTERLENDPFWVNEDDIGKTFHEYWTEQQTRLAELNSKVNEWIGKYDSPWKARKGRRNAVKQLQAQIVEEKKRIKKASETDLPRLKYLHTGGAELEAYDPLHRESTVLWNLYEKWFDPNFTKWKLGQEPPPIEFFGWVTQWEQTKGKSLARIRYLNEDERQAKQIKFTGIKARYQQSNTEILGTNYIYVMTPDMKFYAEHEKLGGGMVAKLTFHHSSFLSGLPVGAAGKMDFKDSEISVDLESGHYRPEMRHMVDAVNGLKRAGVPLNLVKVAPLSKDYYKGSKSWKADEFIEDLELLKKNETKRGEKPLLLAQFLQREKDNPVVARQIRDAMMLV